MLNRQRLVDLSLMNTSSTVFKVTDFTSRRAFWGCSRKHIRICFFIRILRKGAYIWPDLAAEIYSNPSRNTTFFYCLETSYFHRWSSKQNLCDYLISCEKLASWKLHYNPLSWGALACCSSQTALMKSRGQWPTAELSQFSFPVWHKFSVWSWTLSHVAKLSRQLK